MQKNFLLCGLISFILGVGLRSVFDIPLSGEVWLMMVAFGLAVLWSRKSEAFSAPFILLTSICLLAVSLGMTRTEIATWQFDQSPLALQVGEEIELSGTVVAEPEYKERTVQLFVETETDKVLVSTDRLNDVSYGDKVLIAGKLEVPGKFETDLGRVFDYENYLKAKGVEYRIAFAELEVVDSGLGNPIISRLLFVKQSFINSVEKIIPEPAVGLSSGLLLGVKSALGDDIETDFRRTGIIHIVVLSGYNVMLVVTFIMFCFSFLLPLRMRVVAGVLSIIAFALIVGLSATVVRASVMALLVLLAESLGRKYDVMRALLFAGLVMIIINPFILIYDIGFQLSFMATLGLLLVVPEFEKRLLEGNNLFGIKDFFMATIATQIAVLPLLLYHIGEVSLIAVVVNMLVLPVVSVAMFLTFITGVLGFVSVSLAALVGYAATFVLNYILVVAAWFSGIPLATITVSAFSFGWVVVMYICLVVIYLLLKRKSVVVNEFFDWEIIEEIEGANESAEINLLTSSASSKDLPIFFR